jgi:hypothetical protein
LLSWTFISLLGFSSGLDKQQCPACTKPWTLLAMFRPQRVGLNTIIDLYILISKGPALQNVKELHGIFI